MTKSVTKNPPIKSASNNDDAEGWTKLESKPVKQATAGGEEPVYITLDDKPLDRRREFKQFSVSEKLSTAAFAVMVFYSVSGGPFGCESAVRSAGNFYTLLGFLVGPFIWSVQEAMMTAELASAFPEASGGVAWVEEAFGTRAGWLTGYLGWVSGATDNAIYPVLFLNYLIQFINPEAVINPILRFSCLSIMSVILAYINWRGLDIVGNMALIICAVAMSPFFILVVVGAFKVDPSRWFIMPSDSEAVEQVVGADRSGLFPSLQIDGVWVRPFLNCLFWNLNSFDAAASFVEDIDTPARTLPIGMNWAVVMVMASYLLPLMVALGAGNSNQEDWVDGYLARAATDIVGPWLGAFMVFASAINNIALFQAELSADAYQLMGMAERGHVPDIFAHRSQYGTPTYGIVLGTVVIVVMGCANLDQLIEMLNFNYAIALILEYLAFLKLRYSRPYLNRPYRVPLNTFMCFLCLIPTLLFTAFIILLADWKTYVFSIGVNLVGALMFAVMRNKYFGWHVTFDFVYRRAVTPKDTSEALDEADPYVCFDMYCGGGLPSVEPEPGEGELVD